MKFLLISLNILLVAAVCHLAWTYSSEPLEFPSISKKTTPSRIERKKTPRVKASEKYVLDSPDVTEKKITALVEHNIFKTERVPDAPANKTAQRNNQQIRADMSLVGTYVIGDALGAIILQRLQGNAQQQLKALQQKEYEQYSAATRITDPKKKAAAAAASAEGADAEEDKEPAEGKDQDPKQIVIVGGSPTISANNVFRQHLKVGDTTVTGYKLEEVTRTTAVLTKNNERIELTLLTPSEAGNIARQRQNQQNNNNNQNRNNNNNNNNQNRNNNNNNNNNARNNNNNNNRNNNNANARNNNNNNRNNNQNNARNNNNNRNNRDEFDWF